jgi:hypothetical protein
MVKQHFMKERYGVLIAGILILGGLYLTSLYHYLLFHSLAEIFCVVIACGIFMVAWNSRRLIDNNYLLFLGIAYLFIGGIDMIHTLAYKGMGVFPGYDANLPTQLWISARYIEGLSLLIAPFFISRRMTWAYVGCGYLLATGILLVAIFYGSLFPDCYVEGAGLTPFKKVSEYVISMLLLCSIVLLVKHREAFDTNVFRLLIASIIVTIASELAFTFYLSVHGFSNLIGHYLKILSFYLIYKAIIECGLVEPYGLLFRNLKRSEETLRAERDKLRAVLMELKVLRGLLPICAHCKRIRDTKGNWIQIEVYVRDHSEADFTHSICPQCAKELDPKFGTDT